MARIRTIKPTFWGDDNVSRLSRDARLLLVGLVSFADDQGRFLASTAAISGFVFPHDDLPPAKVKGWLKEIESKARTTVCFYEVEGRRYGWFPNYPRHQRINRPQPSPLPPPPGQETLL